MKVNQFSEQNLDAAPTILVLGYFDGLHRGHQALFDKARELAVEKNASISVLTFPESPILVFKKFNESNVHGVFQGSLVNKVHIMRVGQLPPIDENLIDKISKNHLMVKIEPK